jgi:hypothetical protein
MEAGSINPFLEMNAWPVGALTALVVEERLWVVFGLAVRGGLVEGAVPVSAEEVALLFDQLIALVRALEARGGEGSGAQFCVGNDGGTADV